MQVEGRVFVVTGGGNGVGREVVLGLLARGARVAAVDLRADGLAETVEAARGGDRLSTHVVDVTDRAAVEALAVAVIDEYDRVDGLINVAGVIPPFLPFSELDLATMEEVMAVNFWGVVHTVKAFLPHLVTRPQACVVNVSSMGAFAPVPGQAVYGASKAAVMLLTEGLWAEQRGTSVAVTCVFPGGVASDIGGHSALPMPDVASADEDTPTSMTSPAEVARRIIVGGVEEGRFRVVIGRDARMLDRLTRLAPRRATELAARRTASLLDP